MRSDMVEVHIVWMDGRTDRSIAVPRNSVKIKDNTLIAKFNDVTMGYPLNNIRFYMLEKVEPEATV